MEFTCDILVSSLTLTDMCRSVRLSDHNIWYRYSLKPRGTDYQTTTYSGFSFSYLLSTNKLARSSLVYVLARTLARPNTE